MPDDVVVICNSTAGAGCPNDWEQQLRAHFERAGAQARVHMVNNGAAIQGAVREALAQGVQRIVAGGGDGTISAVASELVGQDAVLGVLPLGTLNHFAKDLGIPLDLEAAVDTAVNGEVTPIDAAKVNDRVFINNSSLGLYPDIVRLRERHQRRLGHGKWRALLEASIGMAKKYPMLTVEIDIAGERHVLHTPFVFVGNNEYTMQGFEIGERRTLQDGRLSLYVTHRTGRLGLLRLATLALLRRLDQARDFATTTATSFTVRTGHSHLRVATDGEVTRMETPLHYRVLPGALKVALPKAS